MKDAPVSRYDVVGAVRLNLSMQTVLLDQLDQAARSAGFTRSGFIAQAVREKLGGGVKCLVEVDEAVASLLLVGGGHA